MRKYNHKISKKANESLNKRAAVVRRQKLLLGLVIILLVSLGILFGTSVNTLASSKADVASFNKYYTSIQIEYGDTLWDIADEYIGEFNVSKTKYIEEICQLNNIDENEIHAGDYIVVPYYSNEIK